MAAASSRRPAKKRKISADLPSSTVAQPKQSILAGRPQNYYAPPNPDQMTKEELAAWRKEERKKRNRESAAASRNKIKGRITELESELSVWKQKYADMEDKMRAMEQHIQLLTQLNGSSSSTQGQDVPLPTAISHPNSPQISPVPSTVTSFALPPPASSSSHTIPNVPNLFPNLLSEPQNSAKVETQQVASSDDVASTVESKEDIKSRAHKIERQAVKSGALFESSDMYKTVKQHEQDMQLAGLPTCDSEVMKKGDGKVVVDGSSSSPGFKSVEAAVAGNEVLNHQDSTSTLETSSTSESSESSSFESSDDDCDDFLDLLVDSLDGEFDPELLI